MPRGCSAFLFTAGTAGALMHELLGHLTESDLVSTGASPLAGLAGSSLAPATIEFYGTIGSAMFLFVWLYYASAVFIVGAEVGWAYDQEQNRADRSRREA